MGRIKNDSWEECAVLYVCTGGSIVDDLLCALYAELGVLAMGFTALTLRYLSRRAAEGWTQSALAAAQRRRLAQDPFANVAAADAVMGVCTVAGAAIKTWARSRLDSIGTVVLIVAMCAQLAESLLVAAMARSIHRSVCGRCRTPLKRRRASSSLAGRARASTTTTSVTPAFVRGRASTTNQRRSSWAPWTEETDSSRASVVLQAMFAKTWTEDDVLTIRRVWSAVAGTLAICYSMHLWGLPRRETGWVLATLVLVAAVGSTVVSVTLLREATRTAKTAYPRPRFELLKRGVTVFLAAHVARTTLIAGNAFVFSYLANQAESGCGDERPSDATTWSSIRVAIELALAASLLLNCGAFWANVRGVDALGGAAWHSVAQMVAPLVVARIDDSALSSAPIVGSGAFGTVRRVDARHVASPSVPSEAAFVAVKSFKLWVAEPERYGLVSASWIAAVSNDVREEAYRLACLAHPHVLPLYAIADSAQFGPCLVLAYKDGGTLEDLLVESPTAFRGGGPAWRCAIQVAEAMAFLAARGVIHRDLKPANILVEARWHFYVSDFGTSRLLLDARADAERRRRGDKKNASHGDKKAPGKDPSMTIMCGTPLWMAPELMTGDDGRAVYGCEVDVFSYGVLLWNLAAKELVWCPDLVRPDADLAHYFASVAIDRARPPVRPDFDPVLSVIMRRAWAHDPDDRPTFDDIVAALRKAEPSTAVRDSDFRSTTASSFRGVTSLLASGQRYLESALRRPDAATTSSSHGGATSSSGGSSAVVELQSTMELV